MRVAIAGAGAVGRSIAGELLENGHEILLIDKAPTAISVERVPQAEWLLADACEITSLDEAALQRCNVVIAATGDDKVNLVVSLLAKTEYGVPRVVARVNNPKNEWLFNESWGVDVAVSTPRLMSALVEEAVSVGDLVRLLRFSHGDANLVELTLPPESALAGTTVGDVEWPEDTSLVTIIRGTRVLTPSREDSWRRRRTPLRGRPGPRGAAGGPAVGAPRGRVELAVVRGTTMGAPGDSPGAPIVVQVPARVPRRAVRVRASPRVPPVCLVRSVGACGAGFPASSARSLPTPRGGGGPGRRSRRAPRQERPCAPSRPSPPLPSPRTRRWAAAPWPGRPRSARRRAGTAGSSGR